MSLQQLCCTRYSSLVHHFAIDSPFESCSWVLLQAQAAALRQVGRGGLNEQAGSSNQDSNDFEEGPPGGQRRGDASAVSTAEIVRHPSETEQVLRILAAQMRGLKHLTPQTGQCRHGIVHRFGAACKPVSHLERQACMHIYMCVHGIYTQAAFARCVQVTTCTDWEDPSLCKTCLPATVAQLFRLSLTTHMASVRTKCPACHHLQTPFLQLSTRL